MSKLLRLYLCVLYDCAGSFVALPSSFSATAHTSLEENPNFLTKIRRFGFRKKIVPSKRTVEVSMGPIY